MFLVFIIAFCAILYPEMTGYAFWILVAVLVIMFQEADYALGAGVPVTVQDIARSVPIFLT